MAPFLRTAVVVTAAALVAGFLPFNAPLAQADESDIDSALRRDLGMTTEQFSAAGAHVERLGAMAEKLRNTDGFHRLYLDGPDVVVVGTGSRVRDIARTYGARVSSAGLDTGLPDLKTLVALYEEHVGTEGLLFIGFSETGYVIQVEQPSERRDPESTPPEPQPTTTATTDSPPSSEPSMAPEPSTTPEPRETAEATTTSSAPTPESADPQPTDASEPTAPETPTGSGAPDESAAPEASPSPSAAESAGAEADAAAGGMGGASGGAQDNVPPEAASSSALPAATPNMSPHEFAKMFSNVEVIAATDEAAPAASPIVGGQGWSGGTRCSFGFPGWTSAGKPMMLTAGHCIDGTASSEVTPVRISDSPGMDGTQASTNYPTPIGTLGWHAFGAASNTAGSYGTDLGLIEGIDTATYALRPEVSRWQATSTNWKITGSVEPVIGAPVCRSGWRTGWRCGNIDYLGWVYVRNGASDVRYVWSMAAENLTANYGDSGGSWVTGHKAVGIMSAIGTNADGTDISTAALVTDLFDYLPGTQLQAWLSAPTVSGVDYIDGAYRVRWNPGSLVTGRIPVFSGDSPPPKTYVRVVVDGTVVARRAVSPDGSFSFVFQPSEIKSEYSVSLQALSGRSSSSLRRLEVSSYDVTLQPFRQVYLSSAPVTVRGSMDRADAGKVVRLRGSADGKAIDLGTVRVGSDGSFAKTITMGLGSRGKYAVKATFTDEHGQTWASPWQWFRRDNFISVTSDRTPDFGERFAVRGYVVPARQTKVTIQQAFGGAWVTVAETTSLASGRYGAWVDATRYQEGTSRIRVMTRDDLGRTAWTSYTRAAPSVTTDPWPSSTIGRYDRTTLSGRANPGLAGQTVQLRIWRASDGFRQNMNATDQISRYGQWTLPSNIWKGRTGRFAVCAKITLPTGRVLYSPWQYFKRQ